MRIGLYVQTWHVGGVAAFCERLAQGLQANGCSPHLILGTPFGKRDQAGRQAYFRLLEKNICPVVCLHLNAYHPAERPWRAAEKIARLNCDALLLSSHSSIAGALGWLAPRTALLGLAHTDDEDSYAEFKGTEGFCDAYVGVSVAIADKLKSLSMRLPPQAVRHIPYGVPISHAITSPPAEGPARILSVCRLEHHQKRVLDLPPLWRAYRERGGTGKLTICGPGHEAARLREEFADELRNSGVCLRGAVPLSDMPAVYAKHDIFLSVSAYEGLPIGVLEAVSTGLYPLLSQIRSGHSEIIEALGAGRLCPVGDTKSFAEALAEMTADVRPLRELRPVIAQKAWARWSLQHMVETYAQVVAAVVQKRNQGPPVHLPSTLPQKKPKVDFFRRFLRKWQYRRHYEFNE